MASFNPEDTSLNGGNQVTTQQKSTSETHTKKIGKRKRYYERDSVVPFEEDFTHEFKGHRNICTEDVPRWCTQISGRPSRQPISRALCAFLNTAKGGTVYLGILDNGCVKGLRLTQYQKDHVVLALDDVFGRFNPPVPKHMWHVEFVPIVNQGSKNLLVECSDESSGDNMTNPRRFKAHVFRTHEYCWCDKDSTAQFNLGVVVSDYIVEVTIHAFDGNDPRNKRVTKADLKLPQIFENENGKAYFRRQASLLTYTVQETKELTQQQVRDHYQPVVDKLRKELYELRQEQVRENSELVDVPSKI